MALQPFDIKPVMYCEKDSAARTVLEKVMKEKRLPPAPIHNDITTLHGSDTRLQEVDLICAGFPCQGFSQAGIHQGLKHEGSGLISHVFRLVKSLKPKVIFLENVPTLVSEFGDRDFQAIVKKFSLLGYDGRYVVMHGYDVKCPQKRKRVYLLFYRRGISVPSLSFKKYRKYSWKKEPVPRMVVNQSKFCKRYRLIGNSVIPELTTLAFMILWTGMTLDAQKLYKQKIIRFVTPSRTSTGKDQNKNAAFIVRGKRLFVSKPKTYSDSYSPPQIVLDPTVYISKHNRVTSPPLKKPLTVTGWYTLHTVMGPNSVLTARQSHGIGTQIRFARDTPNHLRRGMLNPEFLEFLQGYPLGWTSGV